MNITWTPIQKQRLKELNASSIWQERHFESSNERDSEFRDLASQLVTRGRRHLEQFQKLTKRPLLSVLEQRLIEALTLQGFIQVMTPTIISKGSLAKMSVDDNHPLFSQVFWLDSKRCLRPMLAPNLYTLWKDLLRLWKPPIRIFEIGTCYRKESQGGLHLNEFTMLNITELGLPLNERQQRLEEIASLVMDAVGIDDYEMEVTNSVVYGDTLDVIKGIELGSSAMGPHVLDKKWGITEPWVGIGFGLERLLMVKEGAQNVQSMGRSLSYLDGVRLNI
ncbi:pyrrolysine--tRNA(Pyl) ligase large subunit [Sporomusa acidovorans]|uniref:Aminoacyl-transfer RNA synthetases class-II family profile domain-containing protein n=1 Tax=Sporomusa acidovorans (strain ATCC 49682 / DSM 3132 / Mol) TaxID=1123286 RepID=A0ABZ3J6F7_SPOA4|nr:pyrrolysine--tRNA(Pyl) ligase large subunit [Sporomusa acidovorans]OZC18524.1 threonine--tRNA ligase [Sporomusa acidovorans DSM 3132]SDE37220.1 Pyrrolysyl-tRNA synthetase [Sporomusa acidovorans]